MIIEYKGEKIKVADDLLSSEQERERVAAFLVFKYSGLTFGSPEWVTEVERLKNEI